MVAVLDPTVLTGFREGSLSVSAEDDEIYLIADDGAVPMSGIRDLEALDDDELSPIGADWLRVLNTNLVVERPASPAAVGPSLFEGRLSGVHHGESQKMFIGTGVGFLQAHSMPAWVLPGAALDLDFVNNRYWSGGRGVASFSDLITFTRSGQAGYFNSSGVWTIAGNNVSRLNHRFNSLSGLWEPAGFQVEGAVTNLLVRAGEFDNASWTKVDTTITANAANGVGGDATMDLCTEGTAGNAVVSQAVTITANGTLTVAIDFKRGNHDWICFQGNETGVSANRIRGWFNLATGAGGAATNGGTASGAAVSVRPLGNGIYRCILSGAIGNSATALTFFTFSADANGSTTRVNGANRYQDRAQLELGSVATSFVPTGGSTAPRAAEDALIDGIRLADWFNALEGAVVVEAETANPTSSTGIFFFNNGGSSRIGSSPSNSNALLVTDGGVTQAQITNGTITANTVFKRSLAYKQDDFAVCTNGGTVGTDTAGTVPAVDRLYLGRGASGGSQFNGHIRRLTCYPTRPLNATLQALAA